MNKPGGPPGPRGPGCSEGTCPAGLRSGLAAGRLGGFGGDLDRPPDGDRAGGGLNDVDLADGLADESRGDLTGDFREGRAGESSPGLGVGLAAGGLADRTGEVATDLAGDLPVDLVCGAAGVLGGELPRGLAGDLSRGASRGALGGPSLGLSRGLSTCLGLSGMDPTLPFCSPGRRGPSLGRSWTQGRSSISAFSFSNFRFCSSATF